MRVYESAVRSLASRVSTFPIDIKVGHVVAKTACAIPEQPICLWNSSFVMWYEPGTVAYGVCVPLASLLRIDHAMVLPSSIYDHRSVFTDYILDDVVSIR
jgi:hypothetical protein